MSNSTGKLFRNFNGIAALTMLSAVLLLVFYPSFRPGVAHFNNDGPLGALAAEAHGLPEGFRGVWSNLNWLGGYAGLTPVNPSGVLRWLLGPVLYAKFLQPAACLFLGLCTWYFLRQIKMRQSTALLGALAAMLNMNMFSNACWGLGARPFTVGLTLVAMGAIVEQRIAAKWYKAIVAGCLVGLGVMEGYDVGALMSIYFAIFAAYVWAGDGGWNVQNYFRIGGRMLLIVSCAGAVAYQSLVTLTETNVKGIVGTEQDEQTRKTRWDWATQWSLSKAETLRVIIPGLFGYRLNSTADGNVGGDYWGRVGQQPGWDDPQSPSYRQGFSRHSGSGEYAGVLVVLVALWATGRGVAKNQKVFSAGERRMILFWAAIAFVSVLLAWGRHAPFYQVLYQLPYFSTIRNPMKFMHPFHVAVVVLFAYGIEGLTRQYLARAASSGSLTDHLKKWWTGLAGFDRKWAYGCLAAVGVSALGWLLYASSKPALIAHLGKAGFTPDQAQNISRFSYGEVGLYLVMLAIAVAWLFAVLSGAFSGARGKWALLAAGIILTLDLTRANAHWVVYYNYHEKYASNPVVDRLRVNPHEQRVDILNLGGNTQYDMFRQFYFVEWAQHHFPYFNIQSIGIVQMSRVPEDYASYMRAVAPNSFRYWQLTNTRWFLGPANAATFLNQNFSGGAPAFNEVMRFNLVQDGKGMVNAATNGVGPFALYSLDSALPRAKLYADWQVSTNDAAALTTLTNATFDPTRTVLVANASVGSPAAQNQAGSPGTVEITSYRSKHIVMKSKAAAPAVLMLNEKHDPNWRVRIDGKPADLLRCNYIMRGVLVPGGEHEVVFTFEPDPKPLYVSLMAITIAILLAGYVMVIHFVRPATATTPAASADGPRKA